jgi:hypothetical protein
VQRVCGATASIGCRANVKKLECWIVAFCALICLFFSWCFVLCHSCQLTYSRQQQQHRPSDNTSAVCVSVSCCCCCCCCCCCRCKQHRSSVRVRVCCFFLRLRRLCSWINAHNRRVGLPQSRPLRPPSPSSSLSGVSDELPILPPPPAVQFAAGMCGVM